MASCLPSTLLALTIRKCHHQGGKNFMTTVKNNASLFSVFEMYHEGPSDWPKGSKTSILCWPSKPHTKDTDPYEVQGSVSVGDLVGFQMKYLEFVCEPEDEPTMNTGVLIAAESATRKAINAFQVLMAKGRSFPAKKTSSSGKKTGLTRKDELLNDLLDDFKGKHLDFPRSTAETEGAYFLQVLCNALWYLTNQHQVINDAALRKKEVLPIPNAFLKFSGYNEVKRKKLKESPLSADQLNSHSQALYSILLKPVVGSSPAWKKAGEVIRQLAECMDAYREYLRKQNETVSHNHSLDHPVRTIDEHATVEHRRMTLFNVKPQYELLDQEMKKQPLLTPVVFNEDKHLKNLFENSKEKFRYFEQLQLSMPIDLIRFSPGGSSVTINCIVKVSSDRPTQQILIEGARILQKARPYLQEYHTRSQKALFRERLQHVTHVLPSVADFIYKELTLDASTACHPSTMERLRLIFLGEKGLLADLRHLNTGRPTGRYDIFFEHLCSVVEEITAADERRHNIAHLSEWLSLGELVEKTKEKCPAGTPIPSKSLVRLQFAPRNPYIHKALNFTSKIQVQYKIQRRQLRATHPDEHYCCTQFKYFKERAVEEREIVAVFFCDDKAKIPVGEPDAPISTGVRGKKTLAPVSTTLAAKDHDMHKSSLTPSVILQCNVPNAVNQSFVRGTVTNIVNDSVFEMSSPFRHAAALIKVFLNSPQKDAKILMKFTDGGTDQRNTLESVVCASICIFYELDLDMMILARCAPGHSWMNPAERIMSVLNIALQNCALERGKGDEETEKMLKKCGSMASIRALAEKNPEIREKWRESIEPVQSTIRNRFLRLKLKDKAMQAIDPVSDDDIDILQRHLREHFPELNLQKLQKVHTKKVQSYTQWIERHCRQRHYTFQIRKCEDAGCCLPATLSQEDLIWLPDPVINENDSDHFLPYQSVKFQDTQEGRPSLKEVKVKKAKKIHEMDQETVMEAPERDDETEESNQEVLDVDEPSNLSKPELQVMEEPKFADFRLTTAQHARATILCVECRKPRVLYSKHVLTERQKVSLVIILSEFDYTCGAPITPPHHLLHGVVMTRSQMSCASTVEVTYYSGDIGRKDTCCHCGAEGGEISQDYKKQYKTVLPLCNDCYTLGKLPVVSRPFGRKK